ncbi:MAG: DegT/DnrJ/EryC1/StrS family aminotransferase, partial [Hydrogenovibrio crunogenus]|nr:DegT/DnrJ/EryC1/StrS family aminotransferase [Hydrogenovibrio crunogenus]
KQKYFLYRDALSENPTLSFQKLNGEGCNYSYFPVIFETEQALLEAEAKLNQQKIYPRRYFYPSLNTLENIVEYTPMPNSESIAKRILCLPLYKNLSKSDIDSIIQEVLE